MTVVKLLTSYRHPCESQTLLKRTTKDLPILLLAASLCLSTSVPTLAAGKRVADRNKFDLVCATSWTNESYGGHRPGDRWETPTLSGREVDIFSVDLTEMKYLERSPQESGGQEIIDISNVSDDYITLLNHNPDDPQMEWTISINRKTGEYTYRHHTLINADHFPWQQVNTDKTGTCTKAPFTPLSYVPANRF